MAHLRRAALVLTIALAAAGSPATANEPLTDVIVVGRAHTGLDATAFPSRTAAHAALSDRAAPFFDAVRAAALQTGSLVLQTWASAPAVHVRATRALLDRLSGMSDVVHVERDAADAVKIPALESGIQPLNTGGRQMIQAEDIWALGFRGENIKLSVIDTGIWAGHEAFRFADGSSRIVGWLDLINGMPTAYDDNGHGTHVAATAAGSALYNDPTYGLFQQEGVAPRAQLMGAKFLSAGGSGSFADAISALEWSFDNGADITSNSWGASCNSSVAAIQTVRMLTDLGMLSVFTAGGSGPGAGTISGPACGESALSTGAVDQNRVIASFSGRGPCQDPDLGTPPRICPDLVAKGVSVTSAWPRPAAPSGYRVLSGTSMATPFVAGGVVLAEQMKRELTGTGWDTSARAEEAVFKETSLDLGPAGPDNAYGWGLPQLLNIYELLANQDIALIVPTFDISAPVVFEGQSATLTFGVRNAGGAVATGRFLVDLINPADQQTVLRDVTVSLGFLDQERLVEGFEVGEATMPGTYTFRGSFEYTWTDPDGIEHSGSVDRSGTFVVRRVVLHSTLDGFEESALPLIPQYVTFTTTNQGNDTAANLVVEVSVPSEYVFVPNPFAFDPTDVRTLYSAPPPDSVTEGDGVTVLRYEIGPLGPDESFSFESTVLARSLGSFVVALTAMFEDGDGQELSREAEFEQVVGLPA